MAEPWTVAIGRIRLFLTVYLVFISGLEPSVGFGAANQWEGQVRGWMAQFWTKWVDGYALSQYGLRTGYPR